jgi:diaminohydroxyphosphoribosylaminopyrimidine deaminase / 5-amino-6-(5-phosphoribosylamino)uracil reductase
MSSDEQFMHRCLQLAALGKGRVAPNPLVGAVIVYDGKIIGEGYHEKFGQAHAEVNAVASVEDQSLLSQSTIYVSLEPCAHYGKTPPCADLLVDKQFKRVVVGTLDANAQVFKKGIKRLEAAGTEVTVGVCEKACKELNRPFFTFHSKNRPYILLKWAQTINGFIDNASGEKGEVSWISTPETQVIVHQWRSEFQSILVGKNTVLNDNPSLTVRAVKGNNPIRILLDSHNEIAADAAIKDAQAKTIVLNLERSEIVKNVHYVKLNELSPASIVDVLYTLNIQSVLIEGGAHTLQSFIDANVWDEARVITGRNEFISGTKAPKIEGEKKAQTVFFGDEITYIWHL